MPCLPGGLVDLSGSVPKGTVPWGFPWARKGSGWSAVPHAGELRPVPSSRVLNSQNKLGLPGTGYPSSP